jgi:hypothetical protein
MVHLSPIAVKKNKFRAPGTSLIVMGTLVSNVPPHCNQYDAVGDAPMGMVMSTVRKSPFWAGAAWVMVVIPAARRIVRE